MKARESGQIPYASPRHNLPPPYPRRDSAQAKPERIVPPLDLEDRGSPDPKTVERVMDMPNISPGRDGEYTGPPLAYKPKHPQKRHFQEGSSRKPEVGGLFREDGVNQQEYPELADANDGQNIGEIPRHSRPERAHEPVKERDSRSLERGPGHSRSDRNLRLSKDDSFIKEAKEKYQWYNERHLSPPVAVRRSRSLSPPRSLEDLHKEIEQKRKELEVLWVVLDQTSLNVVRAFLIQFGA